MAKIISTSTSGYTNCMKAEVQSRFRLHMRFLSKEYACNNKVNIRETGGAIGMSSDESPISGDSTASVSAIPTSPPVSLASSNSTASVIFRNTSSNVVRLTP